MGERWGKMGKKWVKHEITTLQGGMIGAAFNEINKRLTIWRKQHVAPFRLRYNPTLLTHHFSATFRPFCAVFSPFFRGFRLPGAKTETTGEKWRKMGEIWGRNGRETVT